MNRELPDVQAGFGKGRRARDQITNIRWILKKQESSIYFCFIDYAKAFDCMDHSKLWKILKEMGIPNHLICLREICTEVKKRHLELDMEQQTGFKLGKEYIKALYCHPAYLLFAEYIM